jgi:plastocyanin
MTETLEASDPTRSPRRWISSMALLAGFVIALGGCGGDDGPAGGSDAVADLPVVADSEYRDLTGQDTVTIQVRDNSFEPQYATVSPGTEVIFENRGRNPHNVIAVEAGSFVDVPTDQMQPGDSAERVLENSGEYPYYCSLHATPSRGMVGRIRVAEG